MRARSTVLVFVVTAVIGVGAAPAATAEPTLTILDASIVETTGVETRIYLTVRLSEPAQKSVTVQFETQDGTAVFFPAGRRDYQGTAGTLRFSVGEDTRQVSAAIAGDARDEEDEFFLFRLSNASGARISRGEATATIIDDDDAPLASIEDLHVLESDDSSTMAVLHVHIAGESEKEPSLRATTRRGTALEGQDFTPIDQMLEFEHGEHKKILTIPIVGDSLFERIEKFSVVLYDPIDLELSDAVGVVRIHDNDPKPTISIGDLSRPEGNSDTTPFAFTVSQSTISGATTRVRFATEDESATTADDDYIGAEGVVTIEAGRTSTTIVVHVRGDRRRELDEQFVVRLVRVRGASPVDAEGVGEIINDDPSNHVRFAPTGLRY